MVSGVQTRQSTLKILSKVLRIFVLPEKVRYYSNTYMALSEEEGLREDEREYYGIASSF